MTFGKVVKEHSRSWHSGCYAIFRVEGELSQYFPLFPVETEDDYKDYESTVKAKTNRTRKILTGNSTYLFYDQDRAAQSQDCYPYRRDSAVSHSSNNTDTAPTHKSEAELLSVLACRSDYSLGRRKRRLRLRFSPSSGGGKRPVPSELLFHQ